LPFVICHSSFAIRHLPFVICHSSFAIRHLPFVICHLPFAIRQPEIHPAISGFIRLNPAIEIMNEPQKGG
jgi:hypothetical protein